MSELDDLQVFGETEIGWCRHTPVNETADANGNLPPQQEGFGQLDPRAPQKRIYRRSRGSRD